MTACIDFLFARCNCNELACVRTLEGALIHIHFLRIGDVTLGSCGRVPCQKHRVLFEKMRNGSLRSALKAFSNSVSQPRDAYDLIPFTI